MTTGNSSALLGGASPPVTAIINKYSVAAWSKIATVQPNYAKVILSGALTANTLASIISVTGKGAIQFLAVTEVDATSRSIRAQLTVDGNIVFDFTSAAAVGGSTLGCSIIGCSGQTTSSQQIEVNMPFNSSFELKIASSLTETDKLQALATYWY